MALLVSTIMGFNVFLMNVLSNNPAAYF
jgi:hypothetical protein